MKLITQLTLCYQQAYSVRTKLLKGLPDPTKEEERMNKLTSEQAAQLVLQRFGKRKISKAMRMQLRLSCPKEGRSYYVGLINPPNYLRVEYLHAVP